MQRIGLPENLKANCKLFLAGDVSGTTAYDISGNGNNCTLVNSPTTQRTQGYKGFVFNGSNQYGRTNNNLGISGSAARSYSFTVNASSLSGTYYLMDNGIVSAANRFLIYHSLSGKIGVNTWEAQDMITSNIVITTNKYYRITVTYSGGTSLSSTSTKIYIDGIQQATNNPSTSVLNTTNSQQFVGASSTIANLFPGKMFDILVYDKELSATEVYQDFLSFYI